MSSYNTHAILDRALAKWDGSVVNLDCLALTVPRHFVHIRRVLRGTERACDPRQLRGKARRYAMRYERVGVAIVSWIQRTFGPQCVIGAVGPRGGHRGFRFILSEQ